MVSLLSARDASARIEDDLLGGDIVHAERIAQRQLVLGQGAGLVRAQHVHTRQFLDGHQLAHNRLFLASRRAPTAIVTDSTVGIATGMAATVSTRANCKRGEYRVAAEEGDGNDHSDQSDREDNQVVADLEHRAFEMADGVRLLHQLRRLAEVRVRTGGVDHRADFTLANDRT